MTRRIWVALIYLLAVVCMSGGVWWFALSSDLETLADRGEADLSVASDRLVGQLQRYGELAVLLADHPVLLAAADGGAQGDLTTLLRETADKTGSLEILAVSNRGRLISGSSSEAVVASDEPALRRALNDGALGTDHGLLGDLPVRVFTFAAPVFSSGGPVVGAVVVRVDIAAIEAEWRGDAMMVAFTDAAGVVFASNRSELLFMTRAPEEVPPDAAIASAELRRFPDVRSFFMAGQEIWRLDAGRYLPRTAIHLVRPLPVIGMTGQALVDISPAMWLAGWQALFTAAAGLVVGAFLLVLSDRRRALAERLRTEAAVNAVLERRVSERTAALTEANRALRREIDERIAAEEALKRAQDELIQAGKLSALGQMSAGISHELNQPLMAISSFAENGAAFLKRDKPDKAAENFVRISDLSRRMGRIIRNLRSFARQEVQPVRPVDLVGVVESVLELARGRLKREQVDLVWTAPGEPVLVRGGEVRLQQVVMNLISNAIDAMEGQPERRLELALDRAESVRLLVTDTGPGIAAPDRIFDPFYTTKEVGRSEGMGLGLSISYGIVQGFGGHIRGSNREHGGAVFVLELEPVAEEAAA